MRWKADLTLERITCAVLVLAWLPSLAVAGPKSHDTHRGFVDGAAIAELAGEDGTLVEVSIHGPLLRQVARAMSRRQQALGSFLEDIVAVTAVVVEDPRDSDEARQRMKSVASDLEDRQWNRVARVRDGDEDVWVFVLYDEEGEALDGLTVLVGGSSELVFVNLAGRVDLELVGELGMVAGIPGLDEFMDEDVARELEKYEQRKQKNKKRDKEHKHHDGRSEEDAR